MKLWRVIVEHRLVVLAEDDADASDLAERVIRDEDCEALSVSARLVTSAAAIPSDWRNSIPWSEDVEEEHTCTEWQAIFDAQEKQARAEADFAARQLPVPGTETP